MRVVLGRAMASSKTKGEKSTGKAAAAGESTSQVTPKPRIQQKKTPSNPFTRRSTRGKTTEVVRALAPNTFFS